MKKTIILWMVFCFYRAEAQTYNSYNINLLGHINPASSTVTPSPRYSGCWGWYQASTNKEYAIIGAGNGTYFVDVTVPSTPSVCAFVPGTPNCIWREVKTYQNYCYVVSDCGNSKPFQIIDMSPLPNGVNVIHNDSTLIAGAHTIWIDKDKMYIGGLSRVVATNSFVNHPLGIYSLATPTAPVLLRELSQDINPSVIGYVHDMYVRNDTVYASCANQGLYILKYNSTTNTFSILGSYQNYAGSAFNHSSFLTQDGKHLMFCDEIPAALPIRLVNVENFSNVQPVQTFNIYVGTTAHNPYIVGNDFALVSSNLDGLIIYNISQPNSVSLAGFFDTFPQGGHEQNQYNGYLGGNWGAYPFLPSGIVIANDRMNGVFVLDVTAAYNSTVHVPVGLKETPESDTKLSIYPNPAHSFVQVQHSNKQNARLEIINVLGQTVYDKMIAGPIDESLDVQDLPNGTYLLRYTSGFTTLNEQLIVSH